MIIEIIFYAFYTVVAALGQYLPGDLLPGGGYSLPWGTDSLLVSAVGLFKSFIVIFPPFGIIQVAFLLYLGFLIILRVLRMIPIVGRFVDAN